MSTIEWACPKCKAKANEHGSGGADRCETVGAGRRTENCLGFICECPADTSKSHGQSMQDRCAEATCYHCGWAGTFPPTPRGLKSWEKQALAAGWIPPEGWAA